jgi:hypothetical protein
MPDIIRLRVAASTISATRGSFPWTFFGGNDEGCHTLCYFTDHWYDHGVPELLVGLRVRHGNAEWRAARAIKPHETRAFAGSQTPWRFAFLADQNF